MDGDDGSAPPIAPIRFGKRALKGSSLRKSINAGDAALLSSATRNLPLPDDDDGPAVVRPSLSRAGSTKKKKRLSSRLSFGGDADDNEDATSTFATPKKSTLSAKAFENSSALKGRMPPPPPPADDDDDRPRYSKEYLSELASSTPNTPRDISSLKIASDEDEMMLDASELEGAMVVPSSELNLSSLISSKPAAEILTEAQIRERKERRARIAQEQEYMPLDGSDEDENYISLRPKKKKDESRLIAEDEDLGEGYEEFVEDGGLSLGRKAEKEARKRHRAEMADLINAAEGEDEAAADGSSDDSEAERRAVYEEAQTRAGMDGGLHRQQHRRDEEERSGRSSRDKNGAGVEIPRMKPLPDLGECLAKLQGLLAGMEGDAAAKRGRIADLEREKGEIAAREGEVQTILDQAGTKYQAAMGSAAVLPSLGGSVTQSPLRPLPPGMGVPAERGLESFGTPTRRAEVDDVG